MLKSIYQQDGLLGAAAALLRFASLVGCSQRACHVSVAGRVARWGWEGWLVCAGLWAGCARRGPRSRCCWGKERGVPVSFEMSRCAGVCTLGVGNPRQRPRRSVQRVTNPRQVGLGVICLSNFLIIFGPSVRVRCYNRQELVLLPAWPVYRFSCWL